MIHDTLNIIYTGYDGSQDKWVRNQEKSRWAGKARKENHTGRHFALLTVKHSKLFTKAEFLQASACWPPIYLSLENNRTSFKKSFLVEVCFQNVLPHHPTPTPQSPTRNTQNGSSHWTAKWCFRDNLEGPGARGKHHMKIIISRACLEIDEPGLWVGPLTPTSTVLFPEDVTHLWDHGLLIL